MKKRLKILLFAVFCVFLVACGKKTDVKKEQKAIEKPKEKINIRVALPKAPPAFAVLKMIEDKALGENVELSMDNWDGPEALSSMITDGNHQFFAFPLTVGANLYNKGLPIKLINVNTWGVAHLVSSDPSVKGFKDLKGKEIMVPVKSSPPDVYTQYFLKANGVDPKDVKINYAPTLEIAQMLIANKIKTGVCIEPQVTNVLMKNKKMKKVLSFDDEWKKVSKKDSMIAMAGMGVRVDFLKAHPEIVDKFQKEYEKALNWVKKNPKEAGILIEKHLKIKKEIITKAMPNIGLHFKSAKDAKNEIQDLYKILFDFNPKSIGGKMPDVGLFYEQ